MHWCLLKTDCTIKLFIPKLYEKCPFIILMSLVMQKNDQVTLTFMEHQGNTLINTEKMSVDEHALVLIKNGCTIKLFTPELYENTPFDNFNVTHAVRKNHQVTLTFMENQGNTLINSEKMKVDEHALVLIKKRLHH